MVTAGRVHQLSSVKLAIQTMPPRIHFTCDPNFYEIGLSYQDRDRYEGDLHWKCPGWAQPGAPCECWCHGEEGERIFGYLRRKSPG